MAKAFFPTAVDDPVLDDPVLDALIVDDLTLDDLTVDDLAVVVTHYRTPALLWSCLERLAEVAPGVPVTVVDADSGDGTSERLVRDFPQVRVLYARNHSMANAVNTGLKAQLRDTGRSALLQMNADVLLEGDSLTALLAVLSRPGVGMVGPVCRTPDGRVQHQGALYGRHHLRLALARRLSGGASVRVDWLSGCCQLLRREVLLTVGGMDSSFRFYNEDIEWCRRIRRSSYGVRLVAAEVTHVGGASTPADERFLLEGLRGGMQLSRRYAPRWARTLHQQGVLAYSSLAARWSRDADRRVRYRRVRELFRRGQFDESPFGDTLSEDNGAF